MKSIKTYRAVIAPWKLTAIKWPLVHSTIGAKCAVFTFQLGQRRLIVTTA